ncbi:oxidoreductase [Flammeovirga sp. SJP92]|uniref:oxidoreductase n=1 Tax=Flammeovirga sp. SJP92 TaxID=1775430 RepID=UPI00078708F7|nr:oxidoreductase [Flammeovirga sp. SJP92]KXX69401.1 short-chain dehydrogenase [Flammeovirga sp. SJP92]
METTNKRIWMITGISSGLGKALAETVLASGDFVIGTFRNKTQTEQFNQEYDGKAFGITLDITETDKVTEAVHSIFNNYGRIDVLVNNAGVGYVGAIEEASLEEVRAVFEANFFGTLHLTQTVLPFMREAKQGHILQISSHGGIKAFAGFGVYNASKFALEGFSEALEQEVKPFGIRVSIVEPGPFRTNFAGKGLQIAQKTIDEYAKTSGAFKAKLKGVDGKQEGDPMKASQAIIDLVNADNPSLRMPLGKTALMTINMKLESVKADLEQHEKVASEAVFA